MSYGKHKSGIRFYASSGKYRAYEDGVHIGDYDYVQGRYMGVSIIKTLPNPEKRITEKDALEVCLLDEKNGMPYFIQINISSINSTVTWAALTMAACLEKIVQNSIVRFVIRASKDNSKISFFKAYIVADGMLHFVERRKLKGLSPAEMELVFDEIYSKLPKYTASSIVLPALEEEDDDINPKIGVDPFADLGYEDESINQPLPHELQPESKPESQSQAVDPARPQRVRPYFMQDNQG